MQKGSHRRADSPDIKFHAAAAHRLFLCSLSLSLESTLHKKWETRESNIDPNTSRTSHEEKVAHFFHASYHPPNVHHRPVIYAMMIFFSKFPEKSLSLRVLVQLTLVEAIEAILTCTQPIFFRGIAASSIKLRVHYPRHNKKENI